MLEIIYQPLNSLMKLCYNLLNNYILAVIFLTLLTKLILLPISLWVHRTGLKMVELMPELNQLKIRYYGDKDRIAEEIQMLYKREHYHPLASIVPMVVQIILLMGIIEAVRDLLAGTENILSVYPYQSGGITLLMPLAAGIAAFLLSWSQNYLNPLQREQTKVEQFATGAVSIGISLFLGAFVSVGTCLYWICSNLFSIPQQLLMNMLLPAKKYVDYAALEKSKQDLQKIEDLDRKISQKDKVREKEDYKRFFSIANKHLVFYSEKSGFYKYYEDLIAQILQRSNVVIHYITSDPADQIFKIQEPRIHPYYIGEKKLITLMMKMDADIVVMTTPDLETYHIKRSYVRKDIEYIFVNHGLGSIIREYRAGALDHFDTIYLNNEQEKLEIRAWEHLKGLPKKRLVEMGYPLLDHLQQEYQQMLLNGKKEGRPKVVIAPSWQPDNIMESCIEEILEHLKGKGYQLIVRPHPQYTRHHTERLRQLKEKYIGCAGEITFETDFSSFKNVYSADLLITDWSGVSYEFSFITCRPVLFIHTPMKIMNPEYEKVKIESFTERMRNIIGRDLMPRDLDQIESIVEKLLASCDQYRNVIENTRQKECYNFGCAAQIGAKDIISRLTGH